jgi:hypothetical protein
MLRFLGSIGAQAIYGVIKHAQCSMSNARQRLPGLTDRTSLHKRGSTDHRDRNRLGLTIVRKRTTNTSPNGRQRIPDTSERKPQRTARLAKSRTDSKAGRRLKLGFRYAHGGRSPGPECAYTHTSCRICTSHRRICFAGTSRSLVRPPASIASITSQHFITRDNCYTAFLWGNNEDPDTLLSTSRMMLNTSLACWASPTRPTRPAFPGVISLSIRAP